MKDCITGRRIAVLPFPIALLTCLVPAPAAAQAPRTFAELAPNASGVALAELVELNPYDMRPSDGNAGVEFKLKLVRGSGQFRESIHVITAFGGLRPRGAEPPDPKTLGPLKADSLKKGERYWFAFASRPMSLTEQTSQGLVAYWPQKEPKVTELLEAAVKDNAYRWSPQYDPETGLTYGHVIEKDRSRVRVEKAGKLLWENEIPGTMIRPEHTFWLSGLRGFPEKIPSTLPPVGRILNVKFETSLGGQNEYKLPSGRYVIEYGLDPETGKRLAAWLTRLLPGGGRYDALHVEYDAESLKPRREHRFDWPEKGGKAVGAKTENWWRRTTRDFDPKTGRVTNKEVFRYDDTRDAEDRWVIVSP
jgi:hypothetical protein